MRMRSLGAAMLIAASAWASAAHAALVAGSSASGGTVVDTSSGTEWLRLDVSKGLTISEALASYGGDGFRWATTSELNVLLDEFFTLHGGDSGLRAGGESFVSETSAAAESAWNDLFGLTLSYPDSGFRESLGFFDNGQGSQSLRWYGFSSLPATFNSESAGPAYDIGVFLVRDAGGSVSEPSSALLAAIAALALAGAHRRTRPC